MPPEAMPPDVSLSGVQRWLQAVVVHPGPVDAALRSSEAAREIPADALVRMVRPSWSMAPEERVDVYHGMYLLRMVEALESDYPAVRHFLGEGAFADLAREYVHRYPSRSYTLNRLGDHLPRFLLDTAGRPDRAFLHDLARAELAITEAFDEEPSPRLAVEDLLAVPEAAWGSARLRPIRALRLLSLQHAVSIHLDAAKHERAAARPRRRTTHLLAWRSDYSVYRKELAAGERALLAALLSGAPLGDALGAAVARVRASRRKESVFRWLRGWVSDGLFSSIER